MTVDDARENLARIRAAFVRAEQTGNPWAVHGLKTAITDAERTLQAAEQADAR